MKKTSSKGFASVWDAIADSPEDAANLRVRAELMDKIIAVIGRKGWTRSRPRVTVASRSRG